MAADAVVGGDRADGQSSLATGTYRMGLALRKQVDEACCHAGEEEQGKVKKQ